MLKVVTVDANVQSIVNEVLQGKKRYVVLSFSDDFSSVLVDKVAGPGQFIHTFCFAAN